VGCTVSFTLVKPRSNSHNFSCSYLLYDVYGSGLFRDWLETKKTDECFWLPKHRLTHWVWTLVAFQANSNKFHSISMISCKQNCLYFTLLSFAKCFSLNSIVQLATLTEKHGKVISRLSHLQEDVDKLRSLSDTLSGNYDKSTAEVCYLLHV